MLKIIGPKRVFISLTTLILVIALGWLQSAQASDNYYPAVQQAAALTAIEVRSPDYIPTDRAFTTIAHPTPDGGYLLLMIVKGDCDYDCGIGEIRGEPLSTLNWTIQGRYPSALPFTLGNGLSAFYVPAEPDAEYSLSRIVWDEGSSRYEVAMYFTSTDDMVAMANSAFNHT